MKGILIKEAALRYFTIFSKKADLFCRGTCY